MYNILNRTKGGSQNICKCSFQFSEDVLTGKTTMEVKPMMKEEIEKIMDSKSEGGKKNVILCGT